MSKNLQQQKIPKLRFLGFTDEFNEKPLSSVFSIFNGFAFSSNDTQNKGCRWVKIADVGINEMRNDSPSFLPFEYKNKYKKFILQEGDIVVALTRPILNGKLKIAKTSDIFEGSLLNQRVGKLISNNNLDFVYYTLQRKSLINKIESRISGTEPPNLSSNEIGSLKTFIPNIEEQKKISEFLMITDKWIENLKAQKESFESYKKGMMQKLFSQEICFKDDSEKNFLKWEAKRLKEISTSYNGLVGKDADDFGSGKAFITYKQIFDSSEIDIQKFALVKVGDNEKQNIAKFGDVFFTTSSETPNEVGFSSVLLDKTSTPYLNSFSFGLRFNSLEEHDPNFARFFFRSFVFRKEVVKLAQGSTRYNISKIEFMNMKFSLPKFLEQQKIAGFLTSIDKIIESKQQQIIQADQWKKGLMQRLFV